MLMSIDQEIKNMQAKELDLLRKDVRLNRELITNQGEATRYLRSLTTLVRRAIDGKDSPNINKELESVMELIEYYQSVLALQAMGIDEEYTE